MKKALVSAALMLAAAPVFAQQLNLPRPSPKASLMQNVGINEITINYNRPGVKGRPIWGALVPYDQVWRTGANEATTVQFSEDVMIEGQKLPKGLYSLHTIPGRDEWTVIFNSVAQQWGSYSYDAAKDALRVKVRPVKADFREWLTFEFNDMTMDTATLNIRWENLAVPVRIDTQSTQRALEAANKAVTQSADSAWLLPYRAANFAFDAKLDADAQRFLDMSLGHKETMANLWLKARIAERAGRKADAIRIGEQALTKAGPNDAAFAGVIRDTIAGWKK